MIRVWNEKRDAVNRAIDRFLLSLWNFVTYIFVEVGSSSVFFSQSISLIFKKPYRLDEVIKHMEFIGNKSILIIALTSVFTGMALSFQIYLGFNLVNATNLVGPTVALGIFRELGPVLTGLIVAARAGGAMAARLGTMRVTEQIDAMEVMGVDPKQFLVAPRAAAAIITLPLLCGVFDFVAMLGAHFLCVQLLDIDEAIFWDKIQLWLNPRDVNGGLLKSAIFGMTFAAVCTNKGFNCEGGAKGVGDATNNGVVVSMVLIIVLNFVMTNVIAMFNSMLS